MTTTATTSHGTATPCGCDNGCADVGHFSRLRYFHGQVLGSLELRTEQGYFVERNRLHDRLLHGWGIVCGLDVRVVPKQACDPADQDPTTSEVIIMPGAAVDCAGNEIVVAHPRPVYLDSLFDDADLASLRATPATVYLSLCYHEVLTDPMRPITGCGCDPAPTCEYAYVQETYRICGSLTKPDPGPECEPCCGACGDPCLELVAITGFDPGRPITADQLDFSGRRALARHRLAQITSVGWAHGATYARDEINGLLDDGLEVRLSRPVKVASLVPGVFDLSVIEAGGGRSASTYHVDGEFVGLPATELTDRFTYHRTTGETLQYGDRLMITVRGDFIVDDCCRALDADHLGGGVPPIDPLTHPPLRPPPEICPARPSGDGVEGGEFVSWIFVQDRGESS